MTGKDDLRLESSTRMDLDRPALDGLPVAPAELEGAIAGLVAVISARDGDIGGHVEDVWSLAIRIGTRLRLPIRARWRLGTAALLHDVGKVAIPDEVLLKPGPLTERERRLMESHSAHGAEILSAVPGLEEIARIVRSVHERWDGAGYPDGLAGAAIPIESRIVFACDAYSAMTSDRPYSRARSKLEACAELSSAAGSQFDPNVVEPLLAELGWPSRGSAAA